MTPHELEHWHRPHLSGAGGEAHLDLRVHGRLDDRLSVSRTRHRCEGLPPGFDLQVYEAAKHPEVVSFDRSGYFGRSLGRLPSSVIADVERASHVAVLRGRTSATTTLDYLRDAVGLIQALLDTGGVAVFDPLILDGWSASQWRDEVFAPAGPVPTRHATILVSDEPGGTKWFHTRGMLEFGRPDLSVRGVDGALEERVVELCNRFIEYQALGAVVPDGQVIRMPGLPAWTCRTVGSLEDPDFNNRRIEIAAAGA